MQISLLILVIVLSSGWNEAETLDMGCMRTYKCLPLSQCRTVGNIVYPCNENQTEICCAPENVVDANNPIPVVVRTAAFPENCGTVASADKITGGELASIGQFPWMALLGYRQQGLNFLQFLCGGSVITKNFILTASHCIAIEERLRLMVVRLGELNLESAIDCEMIGPNSHLCADPFIDFEVDRTIPHEHFNNFTLQHDIALIKLKKSITFTEYIHPICVPFEKDIDYRTVVNGKLTVSGWGKADSGSIGGSVTLQYANVIVWDQVRCNISIPPKVRPVRETQLCANGVKKQDACKGDSGGPLTNSTIINGDIRTYQIGIVSFSSAQVCGNAELPTIYTRVDHYLDWIVSNVV